MGVDRGCTGCRTGVRRRFGDEGGEDERQKIPRNNREEGMAGRERPDEEVAGSAFQLTSLNSIFKDPWERKFCKLSWLHVPVFITPHCSLLGKSLVYLTEIPPVAI